MCIRMSTHMSTHLSMHAPALRTKHCYGADNENLHVQAGGGRALAGTQRTHAHMHVCTHVRTHARTHAHNAHKQRNATHATQRNATQRNATHGNATHARTHARTYTRTHSRMHLSTHVCAHVHKQVRTHVHAHVFTHVFTHVFAHVCRTCLTARRNSKYLLQMVPIMRSGSDSFQADLASVGHILVIDNRRSPFGAV